MAESSKWYVVQTFSGYENAVKTSIEKAVENRKMHDLIQQVVIPMEEVTEVTDTKTKTYERKVFPGYVLVKMIMTNDSWHVIRNIRGVSGFAGMDTEAIPLTDDEIYALGVEEKHLEIGYTVGSNVKIIDGPLEGFSGVVEEMDEDKMQARIRVSMFGRETPVDVEFDQIESIDN